METMQRSPERLAVLSQFYLCWCFIALICGIVMDGLLTDYGLSYWWVSGLIAIAGYSGLLADYHLDGWPAFISV